VLGDAGNTKFSPGTAIPDKLYFKIGEVARLVGVEAHVLRYWEKEVPQVRPIKSLSNQRRYRRRDVEIFREIRRLLYEERYTLAGARKCLASKGANDVPAEAVQVELQEHAPNGGIDPAVTAKLQRGLEDLIRFAGEEP